MSTNNAENEWDTSVKKEDLVTTPYGKHHVLVQGPARKPGEPIVLIIPGLGSRFATWYGVVRRLGPNIRTIQYDRGGIGKTEDSPLPRTAENIALELEELLKIIDVKPPFVLVAQSYGGIIVREFIARCAKDDVVGLVLVDTNQEDTHARLQSPVPNSPIFERINYRDAVQYVMSEHLTEEEAAVVGAADDAETEDEKAASGEFENATLSLKALGEKRQLQNSILSPHPVTVIMGDTSRDFRRILAYAKEHGSGSAEELEVFEAWTNRMTDMHEPLLREQLALSSNHRFVVPKNAGHNVQYWEPQTISDEILRILDQLKA